MLVEIGSRKGMLFFFVLRIVGRALDQQVVVRHENGVRLSGNGFFPLVFLQVAVQSEFQF